MRRSGHDAFRIVESAQHERARSDDASRDDRPRERSATDLVDAADEREAAAMRGLLVPMQAL